MVFIETMDTQKFMKKGIKIKTAQSYGTALNRFGEFLHERGSHTRMKSVLMEDASTEDQAVELVEYAKFLSKIKSLSESAYDECFSAVRRNMIEHVKSIEVFGWESVSEARRIGRSLVKASREVVISEMPPQERNAYEARYTDKVPFTEEMMTACRRKYFQKRISGIDDCMSYMGIAIGYHFGNRPSEESSNGPLARDEDGNMDKDHRYKVEDVKLQREDLRWIGALELTEHNRHLVEYISMMVDTHKGETLKMMGNAKKKARQPNAIRKGTGGMESELFQDILDWILMAKLKEGDFFFSRNATNTRGLESNLKLTTRAMTTMMKSIAKDQGVDPNNISAKSLRKALGSSLTHSGVSKSEINRIGRWSTNSNVCATNYVTGHGEVTGTMSIGIKRVSNVDISRSNNKTRR